MGAFEALPGPVGAYRPRRTAASSDLYAMTDTVFNTDYTNPVGGVASIITYSETDHRMTNAVNGADRTAILRTGYGATGQKRAFEIECVVKAEQVMVIGFRNGAVPPATDANPGSVAGEVAYDSNGDKRVGGVTSSYGASWGAGAKITGLYDYDAGTIEFWLNGASQGIAATGITGSKYPACYSNGNTTASARVSTASSYTLTGGFLFWL